MTELLFFDASGLVKRYSEEEGTESIDQLIGELETDAEMLKENHPDLYEGLRAAVCDE